MKRMLKYKVPISTYYPMNVPEGTVFRHADLPFDEDGTICVWAEVPVETPDTQMVMRVLCVAPTGFIEVPDTHKHISTVVDRGHELVWHVFEAE